ncbi:ArsI/CadI family heavy metal resistance metalloenzyme [Teredinibacter turnerae]|uniref:ArsI/CadI family heavy metal resistance metalloenzyme n=1 Tax=Teredinibacter turnerae TaxID=2426 RepID=UPI000375A8E9|nr:ArsI/CadI family heavy metal resistance metalloenzyme [Teredinibacter turnerae]
MPYFHVHLSVDNLATNIEFYSRLFGAQAHKIKSDYAKWLIEDLRLIFAISSRGDRPGLNHFGVQALSDEDLAVLRTRAISANEGTFVDEADARCCYAKSDKHWVSDPQGIPWEHFYTRGDIEEFGDSVDVVAAADDEHPCCVPSPAQNEAAEGAVCCANSPEVLLDRECC